MFWSIKITDLGTAAEAVRARRHGLIVVEEGKFAALYLRPWPKFCSLPQVLWGQWYHGRFGRDRCLLYYNQPRLAPSYLALKYVVSGRQTNFATFHQALSALDQIAQIKQTDAIVTDVANWRISDRLLKRWGWEPHLKSKWHRHFIKRFYGVYSQPATNEREISDPAAALAC